jgi:hypothetical protein
MRIAAPTVSKAIDVALEDGSDEELGAFQKNADSQMGPDFWHPQEGKWGPSCGRMAVRVLGSIVAIPRPMRPCARPGFDGRSELRPVGRT